MPRATEWGARALTRAGCLARDSVRRVRVLLGANNFSRHNRYDRSAAASSIGHTAVVSATELRITLWLAHALVLRLGRRGCCWCGCGGVLW